MLKKSLSIALVLALLSVTAFADKGQKKGNKQNSSKQQKKGKQNRQNRGQVENLETTIQSNELTADQKEGLIFMIEEEKLARDVYAALYDTWGTRVFTNITKSEQKHMDAVENLLNKYELEIPTTLSNIGVFEDSHLQEMYDDLIAKGNSSLIDALEVGVIIEEVDIADLQELIEAGVPNDIEEVYTNLLNASYKHLRAFNRQLSRQ